MSQPKIADLNLREEPLIECFSLPVRDLVDVDELRLDASYYNPAVLIAIERLNQSGMRIVPLHSIVSRIFMPNRFKRIYVKPNAGVPFLQGSHVVHFHPAGLKYLSKEAYRNFNKFVIRSGWILVTRSGTVGRVTLCPEEWDKWAASEHIIRVIPDEERCPSGYLTSFLASPLGQVQLSAQIHGAVVDELTVDQVGGVLVPLPITEGDATLVKTIDDGMKKSVVTKSQAVNQMSGAVNNISDRFRT